jgi:fucose permease
MSAQTTDSRPAGPPVVARAVLFPFILVTSLFALWGFANDVTNPLVKAFQDVFVISSAQSSLVQTAFYGGYATMAIPAALFIRKFTYKAGILVGLTLYAIGAMISWPAAALANFNLFLVALYVLTFGLAFLETTANPFVLSMGSAETATRRLNFAQSFNPMGSLVGMSVASMIILANLHVQDFRTDVREFHDTHKAVEKIAELKAKGRDVVAIENDLDVKRYLDGTYLANADTDTQKAELKSRFETALKAEPLSKAALLDVFFSVIPMDANLKNYLDQLAAKGVEVTKENGAKETVPVAKLGYDALLHQALADFKAGRIKEFSGQVKGQSFGPEGFKEMQDHDLSIVKMPYVVIGMVIIAVLVVFVFSKMPDTGHDPALDEGKSLHLGATVGRLFRNPRYLGGVVAQTAYVGAQIMCWTYIIHYATTNLGFTFAKAQNYNIVAMVIFCSSRFICTFMLKYISPGRLLFILACGAMAATAGTIFLSGMPGLYSLIAISACMSLMFPTIYGIALDGMGEDAKLASAGLIFAIVGGALMPPLQGRIIDLGGESGKLFGLPSVSVSFILPFACFIVVAIYGFLTFKYFHEHGEEVVKA